MSPERQDKLSDFIFKRFEQLAEDTDIPPTIILVKPSDDITGPDYAFIGNRGLLSEESAPGAAPTQSRPEASTFTHSGKIPSVPSLTPTEQLGWQTTEKKLKFQRAFGPSSGSVGVRAGQNYCFT